MTTAPPAFNAAIAHIRDGDHVFQVLNAEGTDWDEAATATAYAAWAAEGVAAQGAGMTGEGN